MRIHGAPYKSNRNWAWLPFLDIGEDRAVNSTDEGFGTVNGMVAGPIGRQTAMTLAQLGITPIDRQTDATEICMANSALGVGRIPNCKA